ncbi:MAG TPA: MerC domain-containing protein [Chitinophagaceae bacterium]|nr:MerC domain-containing protein [Chitinophagaceae bacterium]
MSQADRLGIGAALACVLHCVGLPLLSGVFALGGLEALENPWLEGLFLAVSFCAGFWALGRGCRRHRQVMPLVLFLAGFGLLVFHQVQAEYVLLSVPVSATLLISAHVMNYRLCRQRACL